MDSPQGKEFVSKYRLEYKRVDGGKFVVYKNNNGNEVNQKLKIKYEHKKYYKSSNEMCLKYFFIEIEIPLPYNLPDFHWQH